VGEMLDILRVVFITRNIEETQIRDLFAAVESLAKDSA